VFLSFAKKNLHILAVASVILFIHWYNNFFTTYGFFRDELYYIACSEHLSFGYVDQPPLCAFILRSIRSIFGDSIFAVRLLPSLAHAGTVIIAGSISRQLGGNRFAQLLASILMAVAPGIVGITGIYSMNAIEILLWALTFFMILWLIETNEPRYWIVIGFLLGIGLMNKISMGWMAVGLAAGVCTTPMRHWLKTPWPWYAAGLAVILFLPYIIWNIQNDFAHFEFAKNAARVKYASQNPVTFVTGVFTLYNPLAVPVWGAGFFVIFRHPKREVRSIGIIIITVLAILLMNGNSKAEYFNPAMVVLFAAGSVQIERWISAQFRWIGVMYTVVLASTGLMIMPMAIDLLPPDRLQEYMHSLGIPIQNTEGHSMGMLPQHFADRFGWESLTSDIAEVYRNIDDKEKPLTTIYVQNYGEASAIDFYGVQYELPKVMCGHNSYWLWGLERLNDSLEVLIAVGGSMIDYSDTFSEVVQMKTHSSEYAMPYENNLPIFLCRKPRLRIRTVWNSTKKYI